MTNEEMAKKIAESHKYKTNWQSAMEMAEWKDQQFSEERKQWIEKACEWLRRTQPQSILPDTTIERFKQAMEEQE